MPVLLVLYGLLREQMRHGSTLPCFMCFKVRLYSSCPLLLPALAGGCRAIWERDPECLHVVTIQGEASSWYPCVSALHVFSGFQKKAA